MAASQTKTPAALGFRMPAEWEPQAAVWLSWPHKYASWPGQFRPVPYTFARIVAQISRFEAVRINAAAKLHARAKRLCTAAGADCVSTTLSGYTPETQHMHDGPDFELLQRLHAVLNIPVIAEGRINTPALAARMSSLGAWSIVVGSAITRPTEITKWFVESMKRPLA